MKTTITMTIACLKMFVRNRQALFFSLFMPLMILLIFGNINFDASNKMHLGLVTHAPSVPTALFVKKIHDVESLGITDGTLENELKELSAGNRTAVLDVPDDLLAPLSGGAGGGGAGPKEVTVYVNGSKPMDAQMAMIALTQMGDKASLYAAGAPSLFTINKKEVNVHTTRYIEFLLPGVIAMSIMQMSVFSVAFVFAQYKERGILKRLLATPMKPMQFVTANILTRLIMSVTQAVLFVVLGMAMFHIHVMGPYWVLGICVVLGAIMFLGLGFTISGLSRSVETVPVLSNVIVLPMMFMGKVFFSNAGMPPWLHALSSLMPITFLSSALRAIMNDGAGLMDVGPQLLGMLAWGLVLVTTATLTFRFQKADA